MRLQRRVHRLKIDKPCPILSFCQLNDLVCVTPTQGPVGFDTFNDHRQLVHVRHHPGGASASEAGMISGLCGVRVAAGGTCAAHQPDQVAGVIDPHLVDDGFELAGADVTYRVLLAARPVTP